MRIRSAHYYLGLGICLLLAGGLAAAYVKYPQLAKTVEWVLLGIGLAVAGALGWVTRARQGLGQWPPGDLTPGRLTAEQRRGLRRDFAIAFAIAFAGVGLMMAPAVAGARLLGTAIPLWGALAWAGLWFGVTLIATAPFIRRISAVLLSPVEPRGESGEEGGDEA